MRKISVSVKYEKIERERGTAKRSNFIADILEKTLHEVECGGNALGKRIEMAFPSILILEFWNTAERLLWAGGKCINV